MTVRRLLPVLAVLSAGLCLAGNAPATTTASNRRAAELDAAAVLRRFVVPAGVKPLTKIPPRAGWWLASKWVIPRSPVADRYHLWRVDRSARYLVRFVRAHKPRGSTLGTDGGTAASGRYTASHHIIFRFPAVPGRIWGRNLYVAIVPLPSGGTALRVDAQDAWVWTQTARDRLPSGIRELDITGAHWPRHPARSWHFRGAATIRRITDWVRTLAIVPPHTGCPIEGPLRPAPLTIAFRDAAGAVRARLSVYGTGGSSIPACDAMPYSIDGSPRDSLVGTRRFPPLLEGLLRRG